ncbi:Tim18p Ecym_1467 [Eremothecium cymbalariae DBVPG|uniref:Succinate dehydrogenase [ubiquinone] cytochrome b small subunit n=1 Tax=Eremothecium cymbalariae (strain CBS 270.75 / DBVPG 7215 / KCTC 17166 / NRRL Y-17582) TaxID=931890 RepID=G8JMH6_ERECY|nr:hypothetical protein Ecym_1467 [Eremothecium cymbalariae DBVPG\
MLFRPVVISPSVGFRAIGSATILRRSLSLKPNLNKFKIVPPPPGGVEGDVNEAFKHPETNYLEGSYHWYYERISAGCLIPLVAVPLYGALSGTAIQYPILDALLCSTLLIHVQLGLTSCIIDYIPKRKFGIWHNLAMYSLYAGTAVGLYGIYELETNNSGITGLLTGLWIDGETNLYIFGKR